MKIWLNDKRIIKSSKYLYCEECVLCGKDFDYHNVCLRGYKYETDV